jgi:hypothetical protein
MTSAVPDPKTCHQCGRVNASDQTYCGGCGSALALADYISSKVKNEIGHTIRDRDVLEMDSSIKVFTKAWGWIRLIIGTAVGLLVLAGAGVFWKASDFWTSVGKAKQSVTDTAKQSRDEIASYSTDAQTEFNRFSRDAADQSQSIKDTTQKTRTDISKEGAAVRGDVDSTRQSLQAASKIEPEVEVMRQQLAKATSDIQGQQKVISSSQDFIKSVFASHAVDLFQVGQPPQTRYAVIPPLQGGNTVVLLLLQKTPIDGTLQLQYNIFSQPPNSYFHLFHNVIVFFWGDPPDNLKQKPLSVSYFPDTDDKDLIQSLSVHDGRAWADDQPLPKFNQPDPDFKGNKWMPVGPSPPPPQSQPKQ